MATAPGDVTDLLGAYARPLPIAVLCELLGIPEADRAWIVTPRSLPGSCPASPLTNRIG